MIIKNVSKRLHVLHAEKGKGALRLGPGAMAEVSDEVGARIIASPSGKVGELVPFDMPMPKAKGLSLKGLSEEEAILAVGKSQDQELMDQWAANEDRDKVLSAIMVRKSQILPAVFTKRKSSAGK